MATVYYSSLAGRTLANALKLRCLVNNIQIVSATTCIYIAGIKILITCMTTTYAIFILQLHDDKFSFYQLALRFVLHMLMCTVLTRHSNTTSEPQQRFLFFLILIFEDPDWQILCQFGKSTRIVCDGAKHLVFKLFQKY